MVPDVKKNEKQKMCEYLKLNVKPRLKLYFT